MRIENGVINRELSQSLTAGQRCLNPLRPAHVGRVAVGSVEDNTDRQEIEERSLRNNKRVFDRTDYLRSNGMILSRRRSNAITQKYEKRIQKTGK